MKKTTFLLFAAFMVAILATCSDNAVKPVAPVASNSLVFEDNAPIRFNGNYLEFDTPAAFESTVSDLKKSDQPTIAAWTAHYNFVSMRDLFAKAQKIQSDYLDATKASGAKSDIRSLSFVQSHADIFNFDEQGMVRGLKIFHPDISYLVNAKGLVKIAGHVFQYNEDNIKIIVGGDSKKIPLLDKIAWTDEQIGIVYKPVTSPLGSKREAAGRYSYSHEITSTVDNVHQFGGRLKMIGRMDISTYSTPIYSSTPVCDQPCSNASNAKLPTCNCSYPIIGYNTSSLFKVHYETQENVLGFWKAYRPTYSEIFMHWNALSPKAGGIEIYRVDNLSNLDATVYDGTLNDIYYADIKYSIHDENNAAPPVSSDDSMEDVYAE